MSIERLGESCISCELRLTIHCSGKRCIHRQKVTAENVGSSTFTINQLQTACSQSVKTTRATQISTRHDIKTCCLRLNASFSSQKRTTNRRLGRRATIKSLDSKGKSLLVVLLLPNLRLVRLWVLGFASFLLGSIYARLPLSLTRTQLSSSPCIPSMCMKHPNIMKLAFDCMPGCLSISAC